MTIKTYAILLAASTIILCCSCNKNPKLLIEPISQEYNDQFLTGKGLDPRYFSTNDVMQYYQIAGFEHLAPQVALARLGAFADAHYIIKMTDSVKNINVLFYRKKWFTDYSEHLFSSARDNENRTLEGYSDQLLAWITYEKLKGDNGKVTRTKLFFPHANGGQPTKQQDTISLK